MTLGAHTISGEGARKTKRRVGRGNSSTKGTYAGRGMKGQRSRSGGKGGLQRRGFKARLQKVAKLRGFNSLTPKKQTITLAMLETAFAAGETVSPATLTQKGLIESPKLGVKIVSTGTLGKSLTVVGCTATKTALAAIESAGGKLVF